MDVPYIEHLTGLLRKELGPDKLKWLTEQFHGQKSIEEMFTSLWDLEESHLCLTPTLVTSGKSDTKADKFRSEGDEQYAKENFDEALALYNRSIMAATHPSLWKDSQDMINNNDSDLITEDHKSLALGYASRSQVLLSLEQYGKCVADIDQALAYGCPEPLRVKLEERRSRCISESNGEKTLRQTDNRVNFEDLNSLIGKCSEITNEDMTSREVLEASQLRRKLPEVVDAHPNIPALSNALKLVFTPTKGRHLVAQRAIYPGEVVGMEKSYCNGIYWEDLHSHCACCLMECLTPIPCPNCSLVIFCSEECRKQGLSAHSQECRVLPTLATLEKKENVVTYIAFKLVLQTSFTNLQHMLPILQEEANQREPIRLGFDSDGLYSSTEYRPMYHLVTNLDQRPSKELFDTCVTAFVLTKLLVKSDAFFKDNLGQPITPTREDLLMVGRVLVHHILNVFCNAFQLSDMRLTAAPVKTVLRVFAEGVFPGLSLINHSCYPTVRHYNYGNHMVLRAVRHIPVGEEVTTTYCGSFYMETLQNRREHLLNSYIDCTCEACLGEWPLTQGLPQKTEVRCAGCPGFVSQGSRFIRCLGCRLDYENSHQDESKSLLVDDWWLKVVYLQNAEQKVQLILLKKKAGQPVLPGDLEVLCRYIEHAEKHVRVPCQSFCYAVDTLFLLFCLQFCSPSSPSLTL